jgi:putative hemolysin
MTPRGEVEWIDAAAPETQVRARLAATPHSRILVARGGVDDIIGVLQARDVVQALIEGKSLDLAALARQAPVLPDVLDAVDALNALRDAAIPMALVHDEYGHFEGIVTPSDVLAAIAGAFRSDVDDHDDPPAVERDDGSWLISGAYPVDELAHRLGLPLAEERDYDTVAGLALDQLRHLPQTGEKFRLSGWQFEIVDKLLVSRLRDGAELA